MTVQSVSRGLDTRRDALSAVTQALLPPLRLDILLSDLLRAGVSTTLRQHGLEHAVCRTGDHDADVVLFDPVTHAQPLAAARLARIPLVALTADLSASGRNRARRLGAEQVLPFSASAEELVTALLAAGRRWPDGSAALERGSVPQPALHSGHRRTHQGTDHGRAHRGRVPEELFSPREAEVLSMICVGMSNEEICQELYLGINTIKTYIRNTYRRIGVTTRPKAIIWGIEHGYGAGGLVPGADGRRDTPPDRSLPVG